MRTIRWQLLIALGGFILVVGLLMGQTPDLLSAAPQPVRGGSYTEALIGSPLRLNPVLDAANPADRDVDRLLFRGLVRFDARGAPAPDLAESWAVSADATLYTVALRADARWHDGAPVTADDVIYTFSKLRDEDYPGPGDLAAMWRQIEVIRLDERTVQFQLPEPFAPFFDYLAIGLLPDHLLRGVSAGDLIDHPFNLQPIGTGPFRFDRFLLDDQGAIRGVSLTAWPEYYGGAPFLERIEFRYYADADAALRALREGEVQGLGSVPREILEAALAQPGLNVHSAQLPRVALVFLNLRSTEAPLFEDKRVRQALWLATNRQWIIDRVEAGQAVLAAGPILPSSWAYSPSLEPPPFDPERAAALLDDAGWTLPTGAIPGAPEYVRSREGTPLAFTLLHTEGERWEAIASSLQANWAAVGVQVSLRAVEAAALLDDHLTPRSYQAALAELNLTRSPDPDPYPFWHDSQAESGQNYGGFEDRNISIWLEQARVHPDFGRRADLYQSVQHRFQDQVPALLLFHPVYSWAIDGEIQGVTLGPLTDPSDRFESVTSWFRLARRGLAGEADADAAP